MSDSLVGRCSTCGEEIYEGDTAWEGPDGELYCDEWCVAQAMATEVCVGRDERTPTGRGLGWTYEEAVQSAVAHERLVKAVLDLIWLWRGVAKAFGKDPLGMATVYRLCADRLDEALKGVSPAEVGTGAGDPCSGARAEAD